MAPEQAAGEVDRLDERCDVFGLGAILCEVLTGEPPYDGRDDLEVLGNAVRADLAQALTRLRSCGADAELVRLAITSLSPALEDRPRDAGVLATEMAAYRESMEVRLRAAELAQAQARAKADEERKRRRLTLGLASSVLLTALVVGGGWLWIAHQRARAEQQERELQATWTEEAEEALAQAISLRAQARSEGFGAKCAAARAQATRAQTLLERLPEVPGLSDRVHRLLQDLDEEEADRRLLGWVEEIRMLKAELGRRDTGVGPSRVAHEYESALRAYGVVVGAPPEQAGGRIRQRPEPFRARLVAALDDWLVLLPRSEARKAKWLAAVLAEADPDRWRQQLRVARREGSQEELERLAVGPGLARQPPQALLALGKGLRDCGALQQSEALLRRAQQRYPDDFWLNYELGQQIGRQNNNPADAVGFFAICVALRPRSPLAHLALGTALEQAGDPQGAVAASRRALTLKIEAMLAPQALGRTRKETDDLAGALVALRQGPALRPGNTWLLNSIGVALLRQGDPDGAVESFFYAVAHDPGSAIAHQNLGDALRSQGRLREARTAYRRARAVNQKGGWR
jgi:serine/threonine-protein kinase